MELKVIAYARNGHSDKFGIPRQSREESPIVTRIVFEPEFCIPEALRGIDGFSHLWLVWGFSEVEKEQNANDKTTTNIVHNKVKSTFTWSPTVRPPRLGGNKRMGVFATRSPFRPNPIGLSSVKLLKVESRKTKDKSYSLELLVSGADLLDGTPIYDIKPYLSFTDSHEDAKNGFAEETKNYRLEVDWSKVEDRLNIVHNKVKHTLGLTKWKEEVSYILSQDPRPAYQDKPQREYKLDYSGYTVTFTVEGQTVIVQKIEKI